jgi:pimeloyl-ACP methyl ester carboxylesterase
MPPPTILVRDGCPLHFWLSGRDERPLVVFTHGAGLDHREWADTLPVIEANYRVLCWDVRGHALSRPTGAPWTLARATQDLLAILEAAGAGKAILVGHSMGGNISQEVMFWASSRVQAAVLLGCTSNFQPLSPLLRGMASLLGPLLKLVPYEVLRLQSARLYSTVPVVRAYLYEAFGQMAPEDFRAIVPRLVEDLHAEPCYTIPVPFLLTHGDDDRSGNIRALAPRWARSEPNCTYEVIPHAGHVANMDNPAAFNRLLLDFLFALTPVDGQSSAEQRGS